MPNELVELVTQGAIRVLVLWIGGGMALLSGRALLKSSDRPKGIDDRIAIGLVRWLKGDEAADRLEHEILIPERLHKVGRQQIRAGYFILAFLYRTKRPFYTQA